jgi:hypothetical protein
MMCGLLLILDGLIEVLSLGKLDGELTPTFLFNGWADDIEKDCTGYKDSLIVVWKFFRYGLTK